MGLNQSKSPPAVDLLPPRFDAPLFHPDPTPVSPLQTSFGSRSRAALLEQHFALPGARVSANLCPDKSIGALVSFDIPLTRASDGRPVAFDVSVSGRGPLPALGVGMTGSASLRMDGSGSLIAQGSVVESRVGYFGPEGAREGAVTSSSSSVPSGPLSHLSSIQGMAPAVYARIPIQNHPSYPAPGEGSSGVGTLAPHDMGSRYTALSSPTSLPTLLPEVGVRYASATSSWAAGGHFGAGAHYPIKAWALGRYGGELVGADASSSSSGSGGRGGVGDGEEGVDGKRSRLLTFGVELSGSMVDMFSSAASTTTTTSSSSGRGTAHPINPFREDAPPSSPSREGIPLPLPLSLSRPPPVTFGAGVTLSHTRPLYELSLAYDGERGEAVAGYMHSLVVRRGRIWNPFEASHVKGIYQYVDLGVECRRGLKEPYSAAIGVGGAWQLNRNVLLKARVGSRDAALSVALRSWTEPRVTLCATASLGGGGNGGVGGAGIPAGFSLGGGALAWGVSVSLDQGTLMGSDFRLGESSEHKPVPSLQLPATPSLNATR